jgi:predicted deacetylase
MSWPCTATHIYAHRDDAPPPRTPGAWLRRRVLTAGEGEFAALDRETARARIDRGLELFERLGWPVEGFVAPAWLASAGTRAALAHFSLRYTSTHTHLIDLRDDTQHAAPCLTASPRSAWRRAASKLWLGVARTFTAQMPLIRIGLHPADARHADIVARWRVLLERVLETRAALTKSQALEARTCAKPAPC